MSKLDEIEETPKQQAQNATAALTEVVNEGETPNLDAMPRVGTLEVWQSFEQKLNKLKITAETLAITDASQVAEMKIARTVRLELKGLRVEIEKKRKELGEEALRRKQKIDEAARLLTKHIEPLETRLLEQEQFIERQEEARKQALRDERVATLSEYVTDPTVYNLAEMPQEGFDALVDSFIKLRDDKIKAAKDEEDRLAKEKADALAEQERVRLENERLQQEAKDREIAAETEKVRKLALACERKKVVEELGFPVIRSVFDSFGEMNDEQFALLLRDSKAAKEKEEADEAERQRLQKKIDDDAKAAEAKRLEEKKIADAKAKKLKDEADKLQAQLDEQKRVADAKKAWDDAAEAKRIEEAEKAKRAPDKEKILALARYIREIALPMVGSDEAGAIIAKIESQAEKFAAWIEKEASTL